MKKPQSKTRLQELLEKQKKISGRLMQAQQSNMNPMIINQLMFMLEEVDLQIYDEHELERFKRENDGEKDDGYIV